jgi:acyl carrier protein
MDTTEIKAKLTPIFQEIFSAENLSVDEQLTAKEVPGWDSLSHINMVVAVEKAFRIRLNTREVRSMKKVSDLINLIRQKASS